MHWCHICHIWYQRILGCFPPLTVAISWMSPVWLATKNPHGETPGWLVRLNKGWNTNQLYDYIGIIEKTHHDWWWQVKYFWNFHPEIWGRVSFWQSYFSNGLKPPTSRRLDYPVFLGIFFKPFWGSLQIQSGFFLECQSRVLMVKWFRINGDSITGL